MKIEQGELFSFLGPNGAGKTTTIDVLCCLLKPTSGTASIMGFDVIRDSFKVKNAIGISPQDTSVSERLSCWENLNLIGKTHGLDSEKMLKRSEELLERVGLIDRSKEQVRKFSGGMKRRLSMIMSLIHDPDVLFLDEPTLGLDPQSRRALWEYIESLKGKKTILLTTHYMEEADSLSDRIAVIDEGKIIAQGTSEELKTRTLEQQTMIISAVNFTADSIIAIQNKYPNSKQKNNELEISGKNLNFKEIIDYLYSHNINIYSASFKEPTLEDVFIQLTGKELRE